MRLVAVVLIAACVAPSAPRDRPGPPGTWTCKQIVESCDSMCRTGMCLSVCSNYGSQEGGSQHAALIQCAAANRCYDDRCTRALCGPQVDACIGDGMPALETRGGPQSPPQPPHDQAPPLVPTEQHHDDPPPEPPAKSDVPAPTSAALTGDWSYGAKTAIAAPDPKTGARKPGIGSGGSLRLNSDGRFERATNVEATEGKCKTESFAYAVGAWKLDGATLVLSVKQASSALRDGCHKAKDFDHEDPAKDERRAIRMTDPHELEITDDAGELQSYRKLTK
jgi:hypothetical protein